MPTEQRYPRQKEPNTVDAFLPLQKHSEPALYGCQGETTVRSAGDGPQQPVPRSGYYAAATAAPAAMQ